MDLPTENFILDSCEYTPVYLIENPNVSQVRSYVLAQSKDEQKPVSDLRRFYENSGNLENIVTPNVESSPKPRILKKHHSSSVSNNLKLASFLLPKSDANKQSILMNKNGVTSKLGTLITSQDSSKPLKINDTKNQHVTKSSSVPGNICNKQQVSVINLKDIANQHVASINKNDVLNKQQVVININDISNQQHFTLNRNDNTNRQQVSLINTGDVANHLLTVSRNETLSQQHLIAINRSDITSKEQLTLINTSNKSGINDTINKQKLTVLNLNDTSSNHLATVNRCDVPKQQLTVLNVNDTSNNHLTSVNGNDISKQQITMINLNETLNKQNLVAINKNDPANKHLTMLNNVVLQPAVTKPNTLAVSSVPIINIDRKIVKVDKIPAIKKSPGRLIPKTKPKEIKPNPAKHTSVQLLKLGETYHSLNQLSDDQMKVVNQALKIFSNPEKSMEPTYDPVTNTRFIYKVVSPKDLTVVGRNKIVINDKRPGIRLENIKNEVNVEEQTDVEQFLDMKQFIKKDVKFHEIKKVLKNGKQDSEDGATVKNHVTRSGRQVKLPKKQLKQEETSPKQKRKNGNVVTCFQCKAEFSGLYRLQRHYEIYPTHIPARIHSNLFHCLLAIIKDKPEEHSTNTFIEQLEQLIAKLKSLLPCLLKKIDGKVGKSCNINDDIGRLFGISPGNYNLNIDALNCVKDKHGQCTHFPRKPLDQSASDVKPTQIWTCKHKEEILKNENETEDCARINSVDKWPKVSKRIWKFKQNKSQNVNAKKIKLQTENSNSLIELGEEDIVICNDNHEQSAINSTQSIAEPQSDIKNLPIQIMSDEEINPVTVEDQSTKPKIIHPQFHSTHFDIRSSPIKPSSAVFSKFQIDPDKIAKYDLQIIQPLSLASKNDLPKEIDNQENQESCCSSLNLPNLLDIEMSCKDNNVINRDLNFDPKEWSLNTSNDEQSNDSYLKSNSLIEAALLQVSEECKPTDHNQNDHLDADDNRLLSSQGQSVLNFLDTLSNDCLAYPETEIRNTSVDFNLDLFSFHNS